MPDVKFECLGLTCRATRSLQAWCMVEIGRYQAMFQHANPVEVPYKAGSRIRMDTDGYGMS